MEDDKELLQYLVDNCMSYSEILRKLGKSISGASVKQLKKKLDEYGIIHDNIIYKNDAIIEKDLSEILQKDVSYNSTRLKNRLIKAGLKTNLCETPGCPCSISNIWNGKEITYQLDHINGDHYDNRLENLRILCPNCHTLTETYGRKSRSPKKVCPDCGKPIDNRSEYCVVCSPKHRSTNNKLDVYPTKDELLNLILTNSFTKIGKMYGVTDNAVRKWCKKYDLPFTKKQIKDFIKQLRDV